MLGLETEIPPSQLSETTCSGRRLHHHTWFGSSFSCSLLLASYSEPYSTILMLLCYSTGGDCTAMLVEELTDIDADVWDAHLEEEDSRPENTTQQLTTNSSSSSSENADSDTYICTVEVHSDPYLKEADDPIPDQTIQSQGSDQVSLNQTTDEDVSTQALDISQSNITTPSYYSAQSSSAPSITTLHSPDDTPPTSSVSSPASRGELAQEIVNVVQSEDFAEDAGSAVLRCGSSQLCLFSSAANNSRGCLGDTEQCTPIRTGGFTSSTPASSVRVGQDGRERIVIPLSELDNYFGWEEDWDQELQTML